MDVLGKSRTYSFRVRYAETDQMGIAHHSNYFVWFEEGSHSHLRIANEEAYDKAIRDWLSELSKLKIFRNGGDFEVFV